MFSSRFPATMLLAPAAATVFLAQVASTMFPSPAPAIMLPRASAAVPADPKKRCLLLAVNNNEADAVFDIFGQGEPKFFGQGNGRVSCLRLPQCGEYEVLFITTHQGGGGVTGVGQMLSAYKSLEQQGKAPGIDLIASVGVAYGWDAKGQDVLDVIFAERIVSCGHAKVGPNEEWAVRGDIASLGRDVVGAFATINHSCRQSELWPMVHIGDLLSSDVLVNNAKFKASLEAGNRKVVGGEMEAHAIYDAARNWEKSFMVVKGISDWGDGTKNSTTLDEKIQIQRHAAKAATLVLWSYLSDGAFPPDTDRFRHSEFVEAKAKLRTLASEKMSPHQAT